MGALPLDMDPEGQIEALTFFHSRTPGEIRETLVVSNYHCESRQGSKIDRDQDVVTDQWYICPHCKKGPLKMEHEVPETCERCGLEVLRVGNALKCVLRKSS